MQQDEATRSRWNDTLSGKISDVTVSSINLITYNGRLNFPFCCKEEAKRKKHKRSGGTTGKAKFYFI